MQKRPNYFFKIWRVVYPLLIHYGSLMLIAILGLFVIAFAMVSRFSGTTVDFSSADLFVNLLRVYLEKAVLLTGIGNLFSIPFLLMLMRVDHRKYPLGKITHTAPAVAYLIPALAGIAFCIAGNTFLTLLPIAETSSDTIQMEELMNSGSSLEQYLCVAILAPIGEELAFRGLAYRRIRDFLPAWAAILLSSLAFGVYHGNVLQGIYASLLGCVLAYSYEKFQNIVAPILIHIFANATSCLLTDVTWFDFMFETKTGLIVSMIVTLILGMGLLVLAKFTTKVTREERPEPNLPIRRAPVPVYVAPAYSPQVAYLQPAYPQVPYLQPAYPQVPYQQPAYPQAPYQQSAYPQVPYQQSAYSQVPPQ